ncbi:DEAD/DEAH box helicase [Lacihabitans lacunae]|uniref:DEAD/DEAH box helicase n=1 Tax=Lacihabitans lacunae TaxID=1028214 RepID=A0ABV7YY09_9BACT
MFVSPAEPFKIIYSLFEHEYLGYLLESYVVQLNAKGEITYQTQNVSSKNIKEFASGLDQLDFDLVKLMDNIQQDVILKKFNTRKITPQEFFTRVFDSEKGDKLLKETIESYLDNHRKEIFSKIRTKSFFIMSNDGIPTWKEIQIMQEPAKAYFHFERQEEQTIYYPIIKCGPDKVKFQFKNATIINDLPAAMLLEDKMYLFDKYADGKKIKPFLNKPNIIIPKKIEDTYYHKFIVPLVANFNVFAKGFEIINEEHEGSPQLIITEIENQLLQQEELFGSQKKIQIDKAEETKMYVDLSFKYGSFEFRFDNFSNPSYVNLEKSEDSWVFHKVKKDLDREKEVLLAVKKLGLNLKNGRLTLPKDEVLDWLHANRNSLEQAGLEVVQNLKNKVRYFLGNSKLELKIEEKNDWFDIYTLVEFGDYSIPFVKLRKYILNNIREFELPNGQMAVIPKEWFVRYSELFSNLEMDDNENPTLHKQHIGMVNDLEVQGLAVTMMSRKLQTLKNFEEIAEVELPKHFKGELRPYQKAGYDWLHFLRDFKFGGCLADDMGLGKTVTTLAFLQKIKEEKPDAPSLLVMPTSLIYNWQKEAQRFTPLMRVLIHFGGNRAKSTEFFGAYDLIICSYGVLRLDIDFIKNFRFNYAILDESQAIKNSTSIIFKSVMKLNTQNRLILTGTPLENSTTDLWSQMSFVNPGLLGSASYFKNQFQNQIEKQKDEAVLHKLFAKIKPFMLRRHKSQVAKDLPEKIEAVQYCQMTDEQERIYEETKSYVRNQLLNEVGKEGIKKSNIMVLQGLNKLRQLANNPLMIDENYEGGSGKDEDVFYKLQDVAEEGYKTLVFSQYVKHLTLIRKKLDDAKIPYYYLDGATKNRQDLVDKFQTNPDVKVFLISLKAGGVGLNLTAAEYVFILDPWWNPAIEAQAIDRAHRIGQTNTVFSYKFITKNTIEEKILDLQNTKKQLFNDLITNEEGFMKSLNSDDILSLLD